MKITILLFILFVNFNNMLLASNKFEKVDTQDGIEEYLLKSNGLKVLLMQKESLPVATVMITYNVGSRNESKGLTGATHILEHMMFMGTTKFSKENNNDYSTQMIDIGAVSNATTSFDRTNYYATLPKSHIELAIELEADRMRNLLINAEDLTSEMVVVRNEYERGENSPMMALYKKIFSAGFKKHPYNHFPIGLKKDIESITADKLRAFYDTYYWPNNATLTIIGNFNKEDVLNSIYNYFGNIEMSPNPIPSIDIKEPKQFSPNRVTVNRAGMIGALCIAYKLPEGIHKDWPSILLLSQIISSDKTGRLYRELEDKGLASSSYAYPLRLKDPGMILFGATLTEQSNHDEIEKIILDVITQIQVKGISDEELNLAKSVFNADEIYQKDGTYLIADQINDFIAIGDWKQYLSLSNELEKITKADIKGIAQKYFTNNNKTTGWYIPNSASNKDEALLQSPEKNFYRDPSLNKNLVKSDLEVNFSEDMQKYQISNVEIITVKMPVKDAVSFTGSIAAGKSKASNENTMISTLTAEMLDKGTIYLDRFDLQKIKDSLGIKIEFSVNNDALTFSGKFITKDTKKAIELLSDQLIKPKFDKDVFDALKSELKSSLLQYENNTDFLAEGLLSRNLYNKTHRNHIPELSILKQDLDELNISDVIEFHKNHYGNKTLKIIFAGDINSNTLIPSIESNFKDWEGGTPYKPDFEEKVTMTEKTVPHFIGDKSNVSVKMGYKTSLKRNDSDYIPFSIANYILGGNFNSRLISYLRKDRGLTYSVYSFHSNDIKTSGNWSLSTGFAPSLLEDGIQSTKQILNKWYNDGVSKEEFDKAVKTIKGKYLVNLSTTGAVVNQIHSFMQRGFAPEYIDHYPIIVDKVTLSQVNESIKRYFNPENIITVYCGSFEKELK